MFSIEHEFDATVITLVDEGPAPLQEDVVINSFAECVTLEQFDPRTEQIQKITLSPEQVRDLAAALDLPEGVYQIHERPSQGA
ncbi:phosphomannomutase [Ruegeria profundi]|uniref:Phosphomannomutase n=1 Tax=Ruegeria profundi TaxID=1685378 RepID=A0A0X3TV82_9RHOB|nr:phosphomannomutase [Ruegeria profundi]KUJ79617.1 phosphomannomutase [Ruegeria profundi]